MGGCKLLLYLAIIALFSQRKKLTSAYEPSIKWCQHLTSSIPLEIQISFTDPEYSQMVSL